MSPSDPSPLPSANPSPTTTAANTPLNLSDAEISPSLNSMSNLNLPTNSQPQGDDGADGGAAEPETGITDFEQRAAFLGGRKVHWPSERTMQYARNGPGNATASGSTARGDRGDLHRESTHRSAMSTRHRQMIRQTSGIPARRASSIANEEGNSEVAVSDSEGESSSSGSSDGRQWQTSRQRPSESRRHESSSRMHANPLQKREHEYDYYPSQRERQADEAFASGRSKRQARGGERPRRRRASAEEGADEPQDDGEETDDEGVTRVGGGHGGLFSSLASMYGKESGNRQPESNQQDLAEKGEQDKQNSRPSRIAKRKAKDFKKRTRRRWSSHALFRRDSTSSVGSSIFSGFGGGRRDSGESSGALDFGVNMENESELRGEMEDHAADPRPSKEEHQDNSGQREDELVHPHDPDPADGGIDGAVNSTTTSRPASPVPSPPLSRTSSHWSRNSDLMHPFATEIQHRKARKHMKQDLNTPYVPNQHSWLHASSVMEPNVSMDAAQRLRGAVDWVGQRLGWTSAPMIDGSEDTGAYRTLAALIISTSGLAGVASPTAARIAPASGKDSETNRKTRKISEYSNPREQYQGRVEEIKNELTGEARDRNQPLDEKQMARITQKSLAKADLQRARKPMRGKREQKELKIVRHTSTVTQRQDFVINLAKALIRFGAPTHSVESWLEATAEVLEVQASLLYLPTILILSFRDEEIRASDMLLLRSAGTLDLYRLSLVHQVYRAVAHDEISVVTGGRALRRIMRETKTYHWAILMLAGFIISSCASLVAFSGSFADGLAAGGIGLILDWVLILFIGRRKVSSNLYELLAAGIIAFAARGLGGSGYFCYSSIVSGALELGSRNIVAGSIRTVFSIVYTLFLAFAISIGAQIMDATGVQQPTSGESDSTTGSSLDSNTVTGYFVSNNTAFDNQFQNGTFTFMNGTASSSSGQVSCYRNPELASNWWYTAPPDWTLFITVPVFAFGLALWHKTDWRSRDMVVSIWVASIGYVVNYFVSTQLPDRSDITSAVQAFTVGIFGNVYSRVFGGSAFPSMVVGILLAVPNAVAAAGGLSQTSTSGGAGSSQETNQQLSDTVIIAIRMVQTAIGLAIGLFAAAACVYPFGKRGYLFAF